MEQQVSRSSKHHPNSQRSYICPKPQCQSIICRTNDKCNVQVTFSREHTTLIFEGEIISQGTIINNFFAYSAQPSLEHQNKEKTHSNESNKLTLWCHRLGHIGLFTIEKMVKMKTSIDLPTLGTRQHLAQCINCPFRTQTTGPFIKIEELPYNISDLVSSDVCSPFET